VADLEFSQRVCRPHQKFGAHQEIWHKLIIYLC
jgi:hypothetical protein